jgi:hypothetical protein
VILLVAADPDASHIEIVSPKDGDDGSVIVLAAVVSTK